MTLTPFEQAHIDASLFAVNLFFADQVNKMVTRGELCRKGFSDCELPEEARLGALEESRQINSALSAFADAKAVLGVSA